MDPPTHVVIIRFVDSFITCLLVYSKFEKVVIAHLIFSRHGKFYKLDILSPEGKVQTPLGIRRGLEKIVAMAGGQRSLY